MNLSKHANSRCQQRAISPMMIDLLLQFGSREKAGDGASKVYFDKADRRQVKAYAGPFVARVLDEHLDLYAVVGDDDKIITVGHRLDAYSTSLRNC